MNPTMPTRRVHRRRGITSAMAMLYLTLFATLSLGFYASITTSVQVARNDQRNAEAGSYIKTDSSDNSGFNAVITDHGGNIVCTVTGRSGLNATSVASKGVSLDFKRQQIATSVFDYAVASKGKVYMRKGTLGGVT